MSLDQRGLSSSPFLYLTHRWASRGRIPGPLLLECSLRSASSGRKDEPMTEPDDTQRGLKGLPVRGRCYTCERPISGQRRYCGPCLAKRMER